ncbi:ABC1 kinase family protein [Enterococcus timonensis]|uniref:ABC1 kinase family protein n=1 Tax=Enterococcus timonensis TaxID=1852364 RepID=UPI0008D93BEC|nr:AarF/UbiB family protein [Enterococcus timonensis]
MSEEKNEVKKTAENLAEDAQTFAVDADDKQAQALAEKILSEENESSEERPNDAPKNEGKHQIVAIGKKARLKQIIKVLYRYQVVPNFLRKEHPEKIRQALEELGVTFIKLGQLLSVRPEIIFPALLTELDMLQDSVPADDIATVEKIIVQETGVAVDVSFKTFEKVPLASASIGQTHLATLPDGTTVAVKVQHASVEQTVHLDLELVGRLLPYLEWVAPVDVVNVQAVFAEVKKSLLEEIDYRKEAAFGQRFYQLNHSATVKSPKFYPELSTARLLVMEAMIGTSLKVFLADSQAKSETKKKLGKILVENYVKQVFVDGFFHADPHPGNIFIQENPPQIQFIDFGMMGTISKSLMQKLANTVVSLYLKDTKEVGRNLLTLCKQIGPTDEGQFFRELDPFLQAYYTLPIEDIDFQSLAVEIVSLCQKNYLQMDPAITMLAKAMTLLEGVVGQMDPSLSLLEVAMPIAKQQLWDHLSVTQLVKNFGWDFLKAFKAAPKLLPETINALETYNHGQGHHSFEWKNQNQFFIQLKKISDSFRLGIFLSALLVAGAILLASGFKSLGYISYIGALVLMTGDYLQKKIRQFLSRKK